TASAPTIRLANDAANPLGGDTVFVAPGVYPETVTAGHGGVAPGSPGIDIDKSLTLKSSMGAGLTTITNGGSPPGGHCLPTSCPGGPVQLVTPSKAGVPIDGLSIHDVGAGAFGDTNDTNTMVTGNTFLDNARYGYGDFGSTGGVVVDGNTFTNAGRSGLEIRSGATNVTAQNNCFSMNGVAPPTF